MPRQKNITVIVHCPDEGHISSFQQRVNTAYVEMIEYVIENTISIEDKKKLLETVIDFYK